MKVLSKAFTVTNGESNHHVLALRYFPDRYDEVQMFKQTMHTPCPGDKNTFFHDLDTHTIGCDVAKFSYSPALRYINANWSDLKSGEVIDCEDVWES